jgi:hypothetical protein
MMIQVRNSPEKPPDDDTRSGKKWGGPELILPEMLTPE